MELKSTIIFEDKNLVYYSIESKPRIINQLQDHGYEVEDHGLSITFMKSVLNKTDGAYLCI